jgi:hypothetical protein
MAFNIPVFPIFDVDGDITSVGPRWTKWLTRFENMLVALGVTDKERKKALLLHIAGERVNDIFDALNIEFETSEDMYEKTKKSLSEHFEPKRNVRFEIFNFRQARQMSSETLDQYHVRLRGLAKYCEFESIDNEIMSHIIQTCTSSNIRRRALRDDKLTLKNLLELACTLEMAEVQATGIEAAVAPEQMRINQVREVDKFVNKVSNNSAGYYKDTQKEINTYEHKQNSQREKKCFYCGGSYPHYKRICSAKGKICHKCGKEGHFARCCKNRGQVKQAVNSMNNERSDSMVTSEDEEARYVFVINMPDVNQSISQYGENGVNEHIPYIEISIEGTPIKMLIDSGSCVNLIDKDSYNKLSKIGILQETKTKIFSYGANAPIALIGSFTANVCYNNKKILAEFHVTEGASGCLLSYNTASRLEIIKIRVCETSTRTIKEQFPELFKGIGKLRNYQLKLEVNPEVKPVAQRCRKIPFHMREKVETEIKKLLDWGVIEKAEGATPWVSPIVIIPKPNNTEEVRLCIDMRQVNKAILRQRNPSPTIEDVLFTVNGSRWFSKIDLKSAYHQLELHPESRHLTTFATHNGLYRYCRLNFGISCASEIFQQTMADLLRGIPGVINMVDDVLVHAETEEEHDKRLILTLQRLKESGLTLNDKGEYKVQKLLFSGHVLSSEGVSINPAKAAAVAQIPPPTSISELRSLLGLFNYVARFIHNYSTRIHPLTTLLRKDVTWYWGKEQQTSFTDIRDVISSDTGLKYFNPKLKTEVACDASPVGLASILIQYSPEGVRQIVAYASRSLTEVEQRYSQLERECMAIVFGCEKFYAYVYGSEFDVVTDNKPLASLLQNPSAKLPIRLERWSLRLQPYKFKVRLCSGVQNPADYLSRAPVKHKEKEENSTQMEKYVKFVVNMAVPKAMSLTEIAQATEKDEILSVICMYVKKDQWPNKKDILEGAKAYHDIKEELAIMQDNSHILVRGTRIVLPFSLWNRAVETAHEGHQGMAKTKALLRTKIWFPGMDRMVERAVTQCTACQVVTDLHKREPLKMSPLPNRQWCEVSADFHGPLPSGEYLLVLIDEYSRYPIVEVINSTSAGCVIPVLDKIFSVFGVCEVLKTDNGPPFNSEQFRLFAEYMGFRHRRITPYWPEANAEVERFMRCIGKILRTTVVEGKIWKQELFKFLRAYRATPHSSTKIPPGNIMFRGGFHTRFPNVATTKFEIPNVAERDERAKQKMKEYADRRRRTSYHDLHVNDIVYMRQKCQNKMMAAYDHLPYKVTAVKGNMITVKRGSKMVTRNSSFFKIARGSHTTDIDDILEDDGRSEAEPNSGGQQLLNNIPVPFSTTRSHSSRNRHPPGHLADYVCV